MITIQRGVERHRKETDKIKNSDRSYLAGFDLACCHDIETVGSPGSFHCTVRSKGKLSFWETALVTIIFEFEEGTIF